MPVPSPLRAPRTLALVLPFLLLVRAPAQAQQADAVSAGARCIMRGAPDGADDLFAASFIRSLWYLREAALARGDVERRAAAPQGSLVDLLYGLKREAEAAACARAEVAAWLGSADERVQAAAASGELAYRMMEAESDGTQQLLRDMADAPNAAAGERADRLAELRLAQTRARSLLLQAAADVLRTMHPDADGTAPGLSSDERAHLEGIVQALFGEQPDASAPGDDALPRAIAARLLAELESSDGGAAAPLPGQPLGARF